jgi:hypothetical protein
MTEVDMFRCIIKRKKGSRDKCKKRVVVKTKKTSDNRKPRIFTIDDIERCSLPTYEVEYKRRKANQSCEEFIEETKFRINFLSKKYKARFELITATYNSDDSGVYEHILVYKITNKIGPNDTEMMMRKIDLLNNRLYDIEKSFKSDINGLYNDVDRINREISS